MEKVPTRIWPRSRPTFRGRSSYLLNTSEGFDEAISHFREAVALDPEFAEAYAQLALATLEKVYYGGLLPETQTALAAPLIDRALVLDPSNSEAYRALGYLKRYELDVPAAKAAFERAIELNPNNASAYEMYGNLMTWVRLGRGERRSPGPESGRVGSEEGWREIAVGRGSGAGGEFSGSTRPIGSDRRRVAGFCPGPRGFGLGAAPPILSTRCRHQGSPEGGQP